MKKHLFKSLVSLLLAVIICFGMGVSVIAEEALKNTEEKAEKGTEVTLEEVSGEGLNFKRPNRNAIDDDAEEEAPYAEDEKVRVSIVLEQRSTIEAFGSVTKLDSLSAKIYRNSLEKKQKKVAKKISEEVLGGEELDVVWNLALAANIVSANVEYGKIDEIENLSDVKEVIVENCYMPLEVQSETNDPNMTTSSEQIGSALAYMAGYTGAGSKVAIIDTGVNHRHVSFDADAFEYSLSLLDNFDESELMTAEDIAAVFSQLNIAKKGYTAEQLYISSKIPFAFNYVDLNLDTTHDNDSQGEHGSHVTGIATANKYVKDSTKAEGYALAVEKVRTQGVAPDAQIINMKVFGTGGGAFDSDYMAAIEDAIVLGADSINLSLGSSSPGFSTPTTDAYAKIMDNLEDADAVVTISAGNAYSYSYYANNPEKMLYIEDVSKDTVGSPGSYTNALTTAAAMNSGLTGLYLNANGVDVVYANPKSTTNYSGQTITLFETLSGEFDYVYYTENKLGDAVKFINDNGELLKDKIVIVTRDESSFSDIANAAASKGVVAAIIANSIYGAMKIELDDYTYKTPIVGIGKIDARHVLAVSKKVEGAKYTYYTGKITTCSGITTVDLKTGNNYMANFSCWGIPGSLKLKPEITAPGGFIYSVNGLTDDEFESLSGTSMAAPQMAGMVAVIQEYFRENDIAEGSDARHIAQSLLMSTAVPMTEEGNDDGRYYPVLQQGAGLANVGNVIAADSYIMMDEDATESYSDGKVKAELGDDPDKTGEYSFSFYINNFSESEKSYTLSSDFFTQESYEKDKITYMGESTIALDSVASYKIDGEAYSGLNNELLKMDFNGDKVINGGDVDKLLDYVTGKAKTIEHAENADIDGDKDIDSADAQLLLSMLNEGSVRIPAGESKKITVTLKLSKSDKELLDKYPSGAYIEGYVFAESITTEEGISGTEHSIPVIGFYGSWSTGSMFDTGEAYATDFAYESYEKSSYFDKKNTNSFYINYAGYGESYFGGNPVIDDGKYYPERNAINNLNGDLISAVSFGLIRNAADSKINVVGEDGTVYFEKNVGYVFSAFINNDKKWTYTFNKTAIYWDGKDNEGKRLNEGETATISYIAAPEYYVNDEDTDWDSLEDGAYFSIPVVIDNTAPTIIEGIIDESGESPTLKLTAKDNQYVAGMVMYLQGDETPLDMAYPEQTKAGEECTAEFEIGGYVGNLYVVVYDYAYNERIYKISTGGCTESIEFEYDEYWVVTGDTYKIEATISPWNNDILVWESSNTDYVTVDQEGNITGVKANYIDDENCDPTVTVTATSTSNPSISLSVEVFVYDLDVTLSGAAREGEGNNFFFDWEHGVESPLTKGKAIEMEFRNTATADCETFFAMTEDDYLYTFDKDGKVTGKSKDTVKYNADDIVVGEHTPNLVFGSYYNYVISYSMEKGAISAFDFSVFGVGSESDIVSLTYFGYNETLGYDTYLILYNYNVAIFVLYNPKDNSFIKLGGQKYYPLSMNLTYRNDSEDYYRESLVTDDDGGVYLSHYNGNEQGIYYLEMCQDEDTSAYYYEVYRLGTFGEGITPVSLIKAEFPSENQGATGAKQEQNLNMEVIGSAECGAVASAIDMASFEEILAEKENRETTGKLNSTADYEVTEQSTYDVEVELSSKNKLKNGKYLVEYDSKVFDYVETTSDIDHYSVNSETGKITFAFADIEEFAADTTFAKIRFKRKEANKHSDLDVTTLEENNTHKSTKDEFEHEFSDVTYQWNADYTECTATHVCSVNEAHNVVIKATITSSVYIKATCTNKGTTRYTATFGEDWAKTQYKDLQNISIDPNNHNWSSWSGTYIRTRVCKDCHSVETKVVGYESANPIILNGREEVNPETGAPVIF